MVLRSVLRIGLAILVFMTAPNLTAGGSGSAASPVRRCLSALARSSGLAHRSWQDLSPVTKIQLDPDYLSNIEGLAATSRLRERFGDGRDLIFYDEMSIDAEQGRRISGWTLQSVLLMRVIKAVFPAARHKNENPYYAPSGRKGDQIHIPIHLFDSAMNDSGSPHAFDMQVLKAANPGPGRSDRSKLRAQLGLKDSEKIVSVYVGWANWGEFTGLVGPLLQINGFDTVLLTLHTERGHEIRDLQSLPIIRDLGINVLESDLLLKPALRTGKHKIIVNKSRGRLNFVHGAADAAIVLGQANFIEPLHAGTPV